MLDQDADEALVRAEDRAVQHDRAVLLAVLADVVRVEPLGQHAVGLDRADLPGAADRVGQVPFELGRVERAFAGQLFPAVFARWRGPAAATASRSSASARSHISSVPKRCSGRSASLIAVALEAELAVDAVGELAERAHFLDDLVLAAEDVRVVLGELAHPHQPVQRAVRLVAVAAAVLVRAAAAGRGRT